MPSSWQPKESAPEPDRGDYFQNGSQAIAEVGASLRVAYPKGWTGPAAQGYVDATETLVLLAQQTVAMDQNAKAAVQGQSDILDQTRFLLGIQQDFLILMLGVVLACEQTYGIAAFTYLWWFAFCVAAGAVVAGAVELCKCADTSQEHADQANTAARYAEVTSVARQLVEAYQSLSSSPGVSAETSRFAQFADIRHSAYASFALSTAPSAAPASDPAPGFNDAGPGWRLAPTAASDDQGRDIRAARSARAVTAAEATSLDTPGSAVPARTTMAPTSNRPGAPSASNTAGTGSVTRNIPDDSDADPAGPETRSGERVPLDVMAPVNNKPASHSRDASQL